MRLMLLLLMFVVLTHENKIEAQNENGKMDDINDFALKYTVPFKMPDGVNLMSDVYLPVFTDSLSVPVSLGGLGNVNISLLEKGSQYIIYDSINGELNPNPYELPTIFVRTPYSKDTESIGHLMAFLGYSVVIQDNRGAYSSDGNYLPMFSDSWKKTPYHPNFVHALDQYTANDPRNSNHHEDGANSLNILLNDLKRFYKGDSLWVSNGSVGMIGASALGNVQYQLAAASKIDPSKPGIKGLFPIVASNEHYKNTAVQNGVFREALVTNWITRQYKDLLDDTNPNAKHTSSNFKMNDKIEVADKAIAYWLTDNNGGQASGYYPNSPIRPELDASFAPVNADGEGDSNAGLSRYRNMEAPMYHLTGWWDIFIEGQVETYNQLKQQLDPTIGNVQKQKLVIGPWAHQTITEFTTGDVTYPENINDFLIDLQKIGEDFESFPLENLFNSEVISWFRYTLNENSFKNIGSPKVRITAAKEWQSLTANLQVLVPSKNYVIPYHEFVNFLGGKGSLKDLPYTIKQLGFEFENTIDISPIDDPFFAVNKALESSEIQDMSELPDVRLYIASAGQNSAGNFWMNSDSFPFTEGINFTSLYLNMNGELSSVKPTTASQKSYVHNPDKPVLTVGGANMTVRSPQGDRNSQGQMNMASASNAAFTMNRPDVLQFTSERLADTLTVIGIPKATLFAASDPTENRSDSTNTDFFVRILEVLPSGEEYFVLEGAVNARARFYAKQMAGGKEDSNAPFKNIVSGDVYEYTFQCMPIGYLFQKGSRIKVLVSSSNYPRYQSNPNVPLMEGEFFLRKPNEQISYLFHGETYTARKAEQTIFMGSEFGSKIELPVYKGNLQFETPLQTLGEGKLKTVYTYPNPANNVLYISGVQEGTVLLAFNLAGVLKEQVKLSGNKPIDVSNWEEGVYIITLKGTKNAPFYYKVSIQH